MRRDYIISQTANGEHVCFTAPKWSGITHGDDVVVDGEIFPVLEIVTLDDENDKEIINILHMFFDDIKKVESRVIYTKMDYTEGKKDE